MSAARKPPPLVCFKWPWSPNPNASPSPCGDLELPWLFKSIRTVAQGLLITGDLPSPAAEGRGGGGRRRQRHPGAAVEADLGEAEQRALAAALSSGRAATVLEFYSPRCRLCASLQGLVRELEDGADGWASFVLADAEDDRWLPELLHYDIRYVPCFVLLDKHGRALAKTGVPKSRQHVIAGLHHLLNMKQPPGQEGKKGFCGETEDEHAETLGLARAVGYDMAYMFAYSMREKTHAHRNYVDDVPEDVNQRRLTELINTFRETTGKNYDSQIGTLQLVLVEGPNKRAPETELIGKTDMGHRVSFTSFPVPHTFEGDEARKPVVGDFVEVKILRSSTATLSGEAIARTSLSMFYKNPACDARAVAA